MGEEKNQVNDDVKVTKDVKTETKFKTVNKSTNSTKKPKQGKKKGLKNVNVSDNTKKVLNVVLTVVIIIVAIFLIYGFRNFSIIKSMQNKIAQYSDSENCHVHSVSTSNENTEVEIDYYRKGVKEALIATRTMEGKTSKISVYNNGKRVDTFIDNQDSKVAILASENNSSMEISNGLEYNSAWNAFWGGLTTRIGTEQVDDKNCYVVQIAGSDTKTYIDSETGLVVKAISESTGTVEKTYEFDNVEDDAFREPNIIDYELK